VKDLHNEIYKLLKKEVEDTRIWKDLPCLYICRINIMKMAILPKAMFLSNAIPIKIPGAFLTEIEKSVTGHWWLVLINLATQKAKIRRITV
jgi:hypothetical protein